MRLVRSLIGSLLKLAYPRGAIRRVFRGHLRGRRFIVRDAMGVSFAWGVDSYHRAFLAAVIHSGDTVYDVGANRGQMALFSSGLVGPKGHVVSFEPMPLIPDDLEENCCLNRVENVTSIRAAEAAEDGQAQFDFSEQHAKQGKLQNVEATYALPDTDVHVVETVRLDGLVERHGVPRLIKIDVEGGAGSVLRGAGQVLERFSPSVFIELHGPEQRAVEDEIFSRGYLVTDLRGRTIEDPTAQWASPLWCMPRPGSNKAARDL